MNEFVGLKHIVQIRFGGYLGALHVIHGVVAHTVTAAENFLKQIRVALHIVAHAKEGGFHPVAVEGVEHPRGDLGDGAIVEGEKHRAWLEMEAPHRFGEKHTVEQRGPLHQVVEISLYKIHNSKA